MEKEDRIKKLQEIKKSGLDPYPSQVKRTQEINSLLSEFNEFKEDKTYVFIVGRLRSFRSHGNLTFAHLQDGTGTIQIALSKKEVGSENYKLFSKFIDVGDFIEVGGECFLTHKGEKSVMVKEWKILTKAIQPLPEKWHGLKNEEERLRKRYLDILFNPEIRDLVEKRTKFWQAVREFMVSKKFLEVETPVLEVTPGGADARPFITHYNALDLDVYLRISMGELWQKRLMVAGLEKTFELGRQFRNEGMDAEHLQDYTQMEFYWAYADYEAGMKLVEELFRDVAEKTFRTLKFKIKDFTVDLGKKWERYDYLETIKKITGVDINHVNLKEIEKKLQALKIEYDKNGFNLARAIDNLWKYCRKQIAGPGFLINQPLIISPLAKRKKDNPRVVERFHVIIGGSELGNGYSELNDPMEQAERFKEQQKMREAGDKEAQMYDDDFIEALEYGMPPTCGFGMSERVFSFFMNRPARECQIFPLMKPEKNKS